MNILPSDPSRWQLSNCTMSGLNFTMLAGGSASIALTSSEILKMSDDFELACVVGSVLSGYSNKVTCTITAQHQDLSTQIVTANLTNNRQTYCDIPFSLRITGTLIFNVVIKANVDCTINSFGISTTASDNSGAIEEIKNELPRLLEDYNMKRITIGASETTLGLITAKLTKNADLSSHFTCTGYATEETFVHIRFYDDQTKELFAPIVTHIMPGLFNVSVPYAYLKVKSGFHNFYVTMQSSRGTVQVNTRGMMMVIEGSGLASRLADAPSEVHDLTVSTVENIRTPYKVFTVDINNNVATFRSSPYTDGTKFDWTVDKVLTDVTDVAIECNGAWYATETGRQFVTESTPDICFVDLAGNLYHTKYDTVNTTQLDSNVTKVSALRGWRYIDNFTDNDMGYIVSYIKTDGKAYYRQYVTSRNVESYWTVSAEYAFTTTLSLVNISSTRTPDFRVATTVEDTSGESYTLISKRYYQGDSVSNINLEVSPTINCSKLTEPIQPVITEVGNATNTTVVITFSHDVVAATDAYTKITMKDANNVAYPVSSGRQISSNQYEVTCKSFVGVVQPVTFTYTGSVAYFVGTFTSYVGLVPFPVSDATINFIAEDFTPKFYVDEHISSYATINAALIPLAYTTEYASEHITSEASVLLDVIKVTYHTSYATENITAAPNIIIELTHVGVNPL